MLVPILLMEDLDMGQLSPLLRRSSIARNRLIHTLTATSRSLVERGLDVSRRGLKTRLRRLRGKLKFLLGQRKLTARMPGGSGSLHGHHPG